jgi:hypothetical protein
MLLNNTVVANNATVVNNLNFAQNALQLNATNVKISEQDVVALLANKSVQFAQITTVTPVATSAKHKNVVIKKVVNANVQLFANITDYSLYAKQVMRSANKLDASANITSFEVSDTWFEHTNCYSIVKHKTNNKLYLYAIFNSVTSSTYFIDNVVATKEQVAQYLVPSQVSKLFDTSNVVHNKTNNVTHNLTLRTIELNNIVSIKANKQFLTV